MQYGVPIMVSGEILVYRTDLLAAAGLEPPRTVEQTLAVARALHDPREGRAGIAGTAVAGPLSATLS